MKRPIILSALVIILVFCYCFWWLAPQKVKVGQAPTANLVQQSVNVNQSPSVPALTTPPVVQMEVHNPLTDKRRHIMDSPDLMKTIDDIRQNGTQDEKDWALFLLSACSNIRATKAASIANASSSVPSQASPRVQARETEIASQRLQAYDYVSQRCKGVLALTPESKASLRADLVAGSSSNSSVLARLHALATTDENRWNDEQAGLLTNALYSDDVIVQREAFYALQGAIDRAAPGGADRSKALEQAFPAEVVSGQLSEFERQGACYVIKLCPASATNLGNQDPPNKSVARLEAEYRLALKVHKDVSSILAIH